MSPDRAIRPDDGAALAPIVLFAFNRPVHLARTLAALAACPEAVHSHLTIHCDGARRDADRPGVDAVRACANRTTGFASVTVVAHEHNRGLAASVIAGVTESLARAEHVIVLEDDLVVSPHFLRYMNDALACYADDARVASIHGYVYPVDEVLPDTFFLEGADCWGWATWPRAWAHFEADGSKLLEALVRRRLTRAFDVDASYPYTQMLEDQIAGRNSSWAIRWHAACFLDGLLTLYPGRSLVENIGNDSSGTHCGTSDIYGRDPTAAAVSVRPIAVAPDAAARAAFARFFRRQRSWKSKLGSSVKSLLRSAA